MLNETQIPKLDAVQSGTAAGPAGLQPRIGKVEIVQYTLRELKKLLADPCFWVQSRLPITKRRILSHIANPRAEDGDTVLIVAYSKGELIAYLGILPDRRIGPDGTPMKFGWLTTWWVEKNNEHRLAAMTLLYTAMKKYSNRIAISSFSDEAKRAYDATRKFHEFARFERRFFILALPASFPVVSSLLKWGCGLKNRWIFGRKLTRQGLEIRAVDSLDEALDTFVKQAGGDSLMPDAACWQWIVQFPWIGAEQEDEAAQGRYAFSAYAKDFRQIPLQVSRREKTTAFLFLTWRDGRLALKYAYYDPADVADVAVALRSVIADLNPWLFVSTDNMLNRELKKGIPFYLSTRDKEAWAYATKELVPAGSKPQMGIGDNIFT